MTQLDRRQPLVTAEQKIVYTGIYLLKRMDLEPEDGGMEIPVVVPSELAPLEEALDKLCVDDMVAINRRKACYDITQKGYAYLDELIAEAEGLIRQYGDDDLPEVVADLQAQRRDPLRARFLWGWYEGEFDDLVLFQQQRGVSPVEELWAYFLVSDAFYDELARDLAGDE